MEAVAIENIHSPFRPHSRSSARALSEIRFGPRVYKITSVAFSVLHRARVVEKSEDCHAEALAQADSLICNCRLPISYFENARLRASCSKSKINNRKSKIWQRSRKEGL
jgi:hypothetical protein